MAQLNARPLGGFTLSDYLFLGSLAGVLLAQATGRRATGRIPRPLMAGAFLFATGASLSTVQATNALESAALRSGSCSSWSGGYG